MKILKKTNWKAFKKVQGTTPAEVVQKIKESGLCGRSGGNFPAWRKWDIVLKSHAPVKYLICNAHESEPGTFKDKFIIENNPELLIEGIMIASYAMEVSKTVIYFKQGYPEITKKLKKAIQKSKHHLEAFDLEIEVILGAGAYICGETTAIIDSIEGLRGEPRKKPPHPAEKGLYGMPTCVNNVETLSYVPLIILDKNWDNNLRLFSVSGNVKNPGVYELPLGISVEKLFSIVKPTNKVKAIYFGCSDGCIPPEGNLDPEEVKQKGAILGNCTIIVVDEKNCVIDIAKTIAEFFVHESCGKCTPCREGNFRMLEIIEKMDEINASKKDFETLIELAHFIDQTSFCGLGKNSTMHIKTALEYFRRDFENRCKSE